MARIVLQSQDGIISRLRRSLNAMLAEIYNYIDTITMSIQSIPQFGGTIYYVSTTGDDTATGLTPQVPLATIGEAIGKLSVGDAINIKAGTYTEVGLDLNVNACELWFEIGVIIEPATGTALTISGDNCRLTGGVFITPDTGEIGLLLTGDYIKVGDLGGPIINGGGTGIKITGTGNAIWNGACPLQSVIGYDIQGDITRLYDCTTAGDTTTIGYLINGSANSGTLRNCVSTGHQTSGFSISTGSSGWTMHNCSSGNNDGRWVDADSTNVWTSFSYDNVVMKSLVFNASGATSTNLFLITGSVLITELSGHVETVLSNDIGNGYLQLDDGANQLDITDSPGPAFDSVPAGSYIHKIDDATGNIEILDSSQVRMYEDATKFGEDPNFQIVADATTPTYIRFTYSNTGTSGDIHWHCRWEPLTDNGFVKAV